MPVHVPGAHTPVSGIFAAVAGEKAPVEYVEGARGRYRLSHGLVEGGQGVVWAGVGPDGAPVAVKLARLGFRPVRTVADEAESMRVLASRVRDAERWLVPILDVGTGPHGEPFYVMPLFEGTLRDLLVDAVPLGVRLDALAQACHAVELLHAASTPDRVLVHRDVKPNNFLVRTVGERVEVHLADFGGLREAALMSDGTHTTILSPHYAPPEQYLPLRGEPDPSMDVFALAAVVYEGVTLRGPPEASWSAAQWHGPQAEELLKLAARRAHLTPAERQRYESLRSEPLRRLIDFDAAIPLRPEDVDLLRNRLEAQLRDQVEPARVADVVEDAVDVLVPVLDQALQPDPRRRSQRVTVLRRAVAEVHDLVAAAQGGARWSVAVRVALGASRGGATLTPSVAERSGGSAEVEPAAPAVTTSPTLWPDVREGPAAGRAWGIGIAAFLVGAGVVAVALLGATPEAAPEGADDAVAAVDPEPIAPPETPGGVDDGAIGSVGAQEPEPVRPPAPPAPKKVGGEPGRPAAARPVDRVVPPAQVVVPAEPPRPAPVRPPPAPSPVRVEIPLPAGWTWRVGSAAPRPGPIALDVSTAPVAVVLVSRGGGERSLTLSRSDGHVYAAPDSGGSSARPVAVGGTVRFPMFQPNPGRWGP